MEYSIKSGSLEKQRCGCLVVGFFQKRKLTPSAKLIDNACNGLLSTLLRRDDSEGKPGQTLLINHAPDAKADRILLVGLGARQLMSVKDYSKAITSAIREINKCKTKNAIVTLPEIDVEDSGTAWKINETIRAFEGGVYKFDELKSEKGPKPIISHITFFITDQGEKTAVQTGIEHGCAIAEGVKLAKDLSNLPGNICTPSYLAEKAIQLGKRHRKLKTKVLEEAEMEKLGMGALLSVSRGSREAAKLIVMEYKGGPAKAKPYVLVGKGLTFDAGGISLKSAAAMDEMKYDMCGGASVFGALSAVALLKLPINVVGLVPASENLPDGAANKPGDIVTSMSGKTIEILNTDAEGRLILCDTLTYAKRFDPEAVIDIATLTGACVVALGKVPSGLLSNNDDLCDALENAANSTGDRVWRLPLWEEYQDQLKSNFADMANIGGRDAGTITASCFLSRFTKDYKWAHLDIAGTAWKSGAEKGATGRPVPLLTQYLINQS